MSSASASASASNVATTGVVRIPIYELLPTPFLKGIEDASVAALTATTVTDDLFNMSRADKVPIADVAEDAIILIPLFATEGATVMTADTVAMGPMMYVKLDGLPQPRSVFGTIVAYSEGTAI